MHKAGSYTDGRGSVSCDARIRNRRGIAVACMPSEAIFRPIRTASSDCRLLTVSAEGRLPFFALVLAMPVDTDIYDFLSFSPHHRQECRIRQGFGRFRLPPLTPIPLHSHPWLGQEVVISAKSI